MPTEANWNHLIDAAAATVQYLLGPLVVALGTSIVVWWRARVTASTLANKTEKVAMELSTKTDETARLLTEKINSNSDRHSQRFKVIELKVEEVKDATNGMKDELVEAVRAAAFVAGAESEKVKKADEVAPVDVVTISPEAAQAIKDALEKKEEK